MNDKPYFEFVGPPVTCAQLAEIIKVAQEQGIDAGIDKHLELADHNEKELCQPKPQ